MTGAAQRWETLLGATVNLLIEGIDTAVFVPTYLENSGFSAGGMFLFTCGEGCRADVQASFDEALRQEREDAERRSSASAPSRHEPAPARSLTERERREAERLIRKHCAWCLARIRNNDPMIAVYSTLKGDDPPAGQSSRIASIMIGGRAVPGHVLDPRSVMAVEGANIAFAVCGRVCAGELQTAITLDKSPPVIH